VLLFRGKGFRSLYSFVRTCTLTTMKCIVLAMLDVICIIDPVLAHILILMNIHSWYSRRRHFRCYSPVREIRSLYPVIIVCYVC
jgi:hypothetical protein